MDVSFQAKILRRRRSDEEYSIYRAALEWDLTDPIVIEKREDIKSEYKWRNRLTPYHHQVTNLITFCRRVPVTLLADDVGLGKTISAGLVVSELISRSRISKILVVCPKLLGPQWQEELSAKFDLPAEVKIGKDLVDANPDGVGVIITTYASARLYLDAIPEDRFQMLVLDEAHKLRNLYGVETPPKVATKFRDALEKRRFAFVLMLTATPIQNRLWDLYSLVDLLSVARGHQNPFGSEGAFARKYIADSREQARKLKPEARQDFQSAVYQYMSRVRRGDAKLYFPEREVQLHKVLPTDAELALIAAIAKPIQLLNRLTQISILQALVSSPEALRAQLNNMEQRKTVPPPLAAKVREIVGAMPPSAKLTGLRALIRELEKQNPDKWRVVIFTTRLETQTTIQTFLENSGLKVGIINGSSGARNQQTIAAFRKDPPVFHVIVSTEAGAEGVNLQVANVLVNYDLPWNPMIVEQRIGRIQRLASNHAKVAIFNIILRDTFEEYIVGRLMEKLQMASHAIGDIEALLQASGVDGDDDNETFEEMVCRLVVESLAGKNVDLETKQAEASIKNAQKELEVQQSTIADMLGDPNGREYTGPRAPALPAPVRSMGVRDFALCGLATMGATVAGVPATAVIHADGAQEFIHFEDEQPQHPRSTLYAPSTPAFRRLVRGLVETGVHDVKDVDENPLAASKAIADTWVRRFGSVLTSAEVQDVRRRFEGSALVRVRATVAHDAYERLVEVKCNESDSSRETSRSFLAPLSQVIDDPRAVGASVEQITSAAQTDDGISEFRRFYLERRGLETNAAGGDERKRQKLEDDFTPRVAMTLVGLRGDMSRDVVIAAKYKIDDADYTNTLTVRPGRGEVIEQPVVGSCAKSNRTVPITCLSECEISHAFVLNHILVSSQRSGRKALPEFTVTCELTGKRLLRDEGEASGVTKKLIDSALLRTSAISGIRAEPEHFGVCEFTGAVALKTELATSEVSGKTYRQDQRRKSVVSGKAGHKDEFIVCGETGQSLLLMEAERCDVTGSYVKPGLLVRCQVTNKHVLPSQIAKCAVTGKRAIKSVLVASSISGIQFLEEVAVRSFRGEYCAPSEAQECVWSGKATHPGDLSVCDLTGLLVRQEFGVRHEKRFALRSLSDLLDGTRRDAAKQEVWPEMSAKAMSALRKGRCSVEASILSPTGRHLAASIEVKTLLGMRTRHAGLLYSLNESSVVGRVSEGQRKTEGWTRTA